eukprot:3574276-Rhodomonas_salina.1
MERATWKRGRWGAGRLQYCTRAHAWVEGVRELARGCAEARASTVYRLWSLRWVSSACGVWCALAQYCASHTAHGSPVPPIALAQYHPSNMSYHIT